MIYFAAINLKPYQGLKPNGMMAQTTEKGRN